LTITEKSYAPYRPAKKGEYFQNPGSDPFFNLKTAAAVAQALLEAGLYYALLLVSS
jgi:hypothetical protein